MRPRKAIIVTSKSAVTATLGPTRSRRRIENSRPIEKSSRMTPSSASVSVVTRSAVTGTSVTYGPTITPASR